MAVPKRKLSKARTRRRKATWKGKLKTPNLVECNHCHEKKLPHIICPNCGYYNGKQIISVKA
jgi:large subunit ribosomal protein L32